MARETSNPGRKAAQEYKADPDNVDSPAGDFQEFTKGVNAETLITQAEEEGDLADLTLRVDDVEAVNDAQDIVIADNTSAITINKGDITANASAISTNSSNISTNSSAISTNATNISNNSGMINNNIFNIGANAADIGDLQDDKLDKAANLSDVADAPAARTNLDVYSKTETDNLIPPFFQQGLFTDFNDISSASTFDAVSSAGVGVDTREARSRFFTCYLRLAGAGSEDDAKFEGYYRKSATETRLSGVVRQMTGPDDVTAISGTVTGAANATVELTLVMPLGGKFKIQVAFSTTTFTVTFRRTDGADVNVPQDVAACNVEFEVANS